MTVQLSVGQKFGKLETIEQVGRDKHGRYVWRCKCECGNLAVVRATNLKTGRVKSCGCLKAAPQRTLRHGHKRVAGASKAYHAWLNLRRRCTDSTLPGWENYGGRGITYDPAWESFDQFLADMGEPPTGTSLDRINNDGPYSKDNCRWADKSQQMENRRNTRLVEFSGEKLSLTQWGRRMGISPDTIAFRLRRGWDVERALTTPINLTRSDAKLLEKDGLRLTVSQWADKLGIDRTTIRSRISRGWPIDKVLEGKEGNTHSEADAAARRRAFNSWNGLRYRCDQMDPDYGGRGITYDPRWSQFENFLADMGSPPLGTSLDRIDVHGPYSKENCRWATFKEQALNRRNTEFVEFGGKRKPIVVWAAELGIGVPALRSRLRRMPTERAMSPGLFEQPKKPVREKTEHSIEWFGEQKPDGRRGHAVTVRSRFIEVNGERLTVAQAARKFGVKYHTLLHRVRNGWPLELAGSTGTNVFRKKETQPRKQSHD